MLNSKKRNINYYESNFKFEKYSKIKLNNKIKLQYWVINYKKRFQKLDLHYTSTVDFSFLI